MPLRRLTCLIPLAVLGLALTGCGRNAPAPPQTERHSAILNWDASTPKVSGYHVYRTTDPKASPGLLAVMPGDATRYVDTTVESGRTYYYSIKAFDATGVESDFSVNVSATIPAK